MTPDYRINEILDKVINTPLYGLIGVASNRLVYISTEDGFNALWSSNLDGEDRVRLFDKPFYSYANISWKDDKIIFTIDVTEGCENHLILYSKIRSGEYSYALDMEATRVTGLAVHQDKVVFSTPTKDFIKLLYGRIGEEPQELKRIEAYMYVIDFNGRYIVLEGRSRVNPDNRRIFVYDIYKGEFIDIPHIENASLENGKVYGDKLLYLIRHETGTLVEVLNLSNMKTEQVTSPEEGDIERITDVLNFGWGNQYEIWISTKIEGKCILSVDGKVVPTQTGYISTATVYEKTVYYNYSSIKNPTSIWRYDPETGGNIRILGVDAPDIIKSRIMKIRFVKYNSVDNVKVPAFIIKNRSGNRNILMYLHGGPWKDIADRWSMIISVLIAAGYNLFLPNYRGSRGYGIEFEKRLIGDPGGIDLDDIIYGYKYLAENGYPNRVGLLGFSYGGFLAFLAAGKYPQFWRCIAIGSGICDWSDIYKYADYSFKRFIETLFGGNIEIFKERSPSTYIKDIEAPLCIVHPENDTRAPLEPMLNCIKTLKKHGKEYELHIIRGAGHVINSHEKFRSKFIPILKFLHKYLLD